MMQTQTLVYLSLLISGLLLSATKSLALQEQLKPTREQNKVTPVIVRDLSTRHYMKLPLNQF